MWFLGPVSHDEGSVDVVWVMDYDDDDLRRHNLWYALKQLICGAGVFAVYSRLLCLTLCTDGYFQRIAE